MSIATVVTRGYTNGTIETDVNLVVTAGYNTTKWNDQTDDSTIWSEQSDSSDTWNEQSDVTTTWT